MIWLSGTPEKKSIVRIDEDGSESDSLGDQRGQATAEARAENRDVGLQRHAAES